MHPTAWSFSELTLQDFSTSPQYPRFVLRERLENTMKDCTVKTSGVEDSRLGLIVCV